MTRRPWSVLIVLVGVAGTAWLLMHTAAPEQSSSPSSRVTRQDLSVTVHAIGAVKPQIGAEVRVGSRISGRVVRLHANIGSFVKEGDIIAELEHEELKANVDERQAELQVAVAERESTDRLFPQEIARTEAEVARWTATVRLAETELAREEGLLAQGLIPQQDLDQAEERLLVAQAELEASSRALDFVRANYTETRTQAEAEIERARAALAIAKAQFSYSVITAPISGVIGSVSTQAGETVTAGLNAPTFVTVVDLSRLKVDAYVDEIDIGKVRSGQEAVFTVDAHSGMEFKGVVSTIHPQAIIHDNIVKYVTELTIDPTYQDYLRPEMTTAVDIVIAPKTVLAVQARAVKREGGRDVVYVQGVDGPILREVKIGWRSGPWAEVLSGVDMGEEVYLEVPSGGEE